MMLDINFYSTGRKYCIGSTHNEKYSIIIRKKMNKILNTVALSVAMLLSGCADAGKDKTVNTSDKVILDGSASTADLEGVINGYKWEQISGMDVTLSSEDKSPEASFIAPDVDEESLLKFQLITTEKNEYIPGYMSTDVVTITVNPSDGGDTNTTPDDGNDPDIIPDDGNDTDAIPDDGNDPDAIPDDGGDTHPIVDDNITDEDKTPPVLTMIGEPLLTVKQGSTYIDAGATSIDNIDGDITDDIILEGQVDTRKKGRYTLVYFSMDSSGNKNEIIKHVIVE